MENLITEYMNHKIRYLINCGLLIFFDEKDQKFVKKCLTKYINTYVNCHFYHILDTLDDTNDYNITTINKELIGIMEEMLYDYSLDVLIVDNEEFNYNNKLIKKIKDVSLFLVKLDLLEFSGKDDIKEQIESLLEKNKFVSEKLDNRINKLTNLINSNYITENKFFNLDDSFFHIDLARLFGEKNRYLVELIPDIKVLNYKYKKSLVDKTYQNSKLNVNKLEILIQKISMKILKDKSDSKYFILLNDNIFNDGVMNTKISKLLDNKLIKEKVVLLIPFPLYTSRKLDLDKDKYTFGFVQDFSHILNVEDKIAVMQKEGFKYIVASNYKEKDKDIIVNYETNDSFELLISKEV